MLQSYLICRNQHIYNNLYVWFRHCTLTYLICLDVPCSVIDYGTHFSGTAIMRHCILLWHLMRTGILRVSCVKATTSLYKVLVRKVFSEFGTLFWESRRIIEVTFSESLFVTCHRPKWPQTRISKGHFEEPGGSHIHSMIIMSPAMAFRAKHSHTSWMSKKGTWLVDGVWLHLSVACGTRKPK